MLSFLSPGGGIFGTSFIIKNMQTNATQGESKISDPAIPGTDTDSLEKRTILLRCIKNLQDIDDVLKGGNSLVKADGAIHNRIKETIAQLKGL